MGYQDTSDKSNWKYFVPIFIFQGLQKNFKRRYMLLNINRTEIC